MQKEKNKRTICNCCREINQKILRFKMTRLLCFGQIYTNTSKQKGKALHLLVGDVDQHAGNDFQQENTEQQTQIL